MKLLEAINQYYGTECKNLSEFHEDLQEIRHSDLARYASLIKFLYYFQEREENEKSS